MEETPYAKRQPLARLHREAPVVELDIGLSAGLSPRHEMIDVQGVGVRRLQVRIDRPSQIAQIQPAA